MEGVKPNSLVQQERRSRHTGHAGQHGDAIVGTLHSLKLRTAQALPLIALVSCSLQLPLVGPNSDALIGGQRLRRSCLMRLHQAGRARMLAAPPLKAKNSFFLGLVAHIEKEAGECHVGFAPILVQHPLVAGLNGRAEGHVKDALENRAAPLSATELGRRLLLLLYKGDVRKWLSLDLLRDNVDHANTEWVQLVGCQYEYGDKRGSNKRRALELASPVHTIAEEYH